MTASTRPLRVCSPHPSKASRSSSIVYLFSSLRPGSPSPRLCWLQLLFWTPRLSCRSKNSQSEPGLSSSSVFSRYMYVRIISFQQQPAAEHGREQRRDSIHDIAASDGAMPVAPHVSLHVSRKTIFPTCSERRQFCQHAQWQELPNFSAATKRRHRTLLRPQLLKKLVLLLNTTAVHSALRTHSAPSMAPR